MSNERAIELADKLRRDHNGIMAVYLYLGHDGDNACRLGDFNDPIGIGCGRTLLDAVQRAQADWRVHAILAGKKWGEDIIQETVLRAMEKFDGRRQGLFNTACFQSEFRDYQECPLSSEQAETLLNHHPCIVRLAGGCHWLLLPDGLKKFVEGEAP